SSRKALRPAGRTTDHRGPVQAGVASAAAHRRHHYLIPATGSPVDFLTGTELQVLVHADPHLAEPGPVAHHGDGGTAEARIVLDESLLDGIRRDAFRCGEIGEFRRDLHSGPRFADGLEI